ncbi:MAG: hypothetical protein ABSA67_12585 [Candidatus Brocadiia bacterium]|jgi:hypothetical protein
MAQPATGSAPANTRMAQQYARISGKITKIDGQALTIAVTANGETKDVVITCNETTRILKAVAPAAAATNAPRGRGPTPQVKFEELKVGQEVMAAYSTADNIARMVRITSDVAAPASGAGEATTTK